MVAPFRGTPRGWSPHLNPRRHEQAFGNLETDVQKSVVARKPAMANA